MADKFDFTNAPESKFSQFKKMCNTAGNVLAITALSAGAIGYLGITAHNSYVGQDVMKEVPAIINAGIEANLKEQGFTGGIYEKMKSIQAEEGVCAPLAKDLRTDYNARVNGVFEQVYDLVGPKYLGEGGTVYDLQAKEKAKEYTDKHMKNASVSPVAHDTRFNDVIADAKPEQVNEMITRIRSKAIKLEDCVSNNPKLN
jgi:hypothetical protein